MLGQARLPRAASARPAHLDDGWPAG